MTETPKAETGAQNAATEETITIVVYEETVATYRVPVALLRDLDLPTTSEELTHALELNTQDVMQDINEDTFMGIVEHIDLSDYAVQERQISFPTDA
jgi:hypothetical protein